MLNNSNQLIKILKNIKNFHLVKLCTEPSQQSTGLGLWFWVETLKRNISRDAEPHHFNADPDPDPAVHHGDANMRPLINRPLQGSILIFLVSNRSVSALFEPLKLLNFDLNEDPVPFSLLFGS